MSAGRRRFPLAILFAVTAIPPASAAAQPPGAVRVVNEAAPIRRWFRNPVTEVLMMVDPGTTLEVLDEERGWYWVMVPRDAHGTQRAGWIRAEQVEPVAVRRAARPTGAPETGASSAPAAVTLANAAEDRVTITTRDVPDESRANGSAAAAYTFEDVYFDRDRYAIRSEDMPHLQSVTAALKANPSLAVNIEGYTCDLGSPAYNLALGSRRANAVRDYLVSQGIAAERLNAVSFGEERPKHDNATEETRRLNRRVAVVPDPNADRRGLGLGGWD